MKRENTVLTRHLQVQIVLLEAVQWQKASRFFDESFKIIEHPSLAIDEACLDVLKNYFENHCSQNNSKLTFKQKLNISHPPSLLKT